MMPLAIIVGEFSDRYPNYSISILSGEKPLAGVHVPNAEGVIVVDIEYLHESVKIIKGGILVEFYRPEAYFKSHEEARQRAIHFDSEEERGRLQLEKIRRESMHPCPCDAH